AATRCFNLAHKHSYSSVSERVLPQLGNLPRKQASIVFVNQESLTEKLPSDIIHKKARMSVNGIWIEFMFDDSSPNSVVELAAYAERDFAGWQHARSLIRSRIEAFSKSDSLGDLGRWNLSVRMESQDFESV